MSEMTIPADLLAPPELLPFMTLQEGAEWLVHRGVAKRPKGLIAAASEGRIQIFAAVPEGAHHGFISPSSTTTRGRTFTFNVGHRFKRGEMVAVSPDDCVQFLQIGTAYIRDAGGQEWIDAGLPDEMAILLTVSHIDAFRVRACDLEAFADTQTSAPACSASASAVALPEPVVAPAEAVPAKWWEAVLPYMVETLKAGRFRSAKEFHRALEVSSGSPGSPFEKVQGELRVRDFGQSVALKTIQNRWKEVRAAARLR